jgi:opacity protein-like surface antigen
MRSLFLVALVVGVCTPAIMAQETAKAGIYGGIQNLRFTPPAPSKRNAKQKSAIYSGAQNLNFNIPETNKQDVNGLPQAPKSTFFSAISPEMDKRYAGNLPLNSRGAGSRVQCPPSCPRDDYNRFEIYVGYSLLRAEFRLFNLIGDDISDFVGGSFNGFDDDFRFTRDLNGVDVSFTYNFSRYVGAQVDFSTHRRTRDDVDIVFVNPVDSSIVFGDIDRTRFRVSNLLFGVQVKDNQENGPRARPFGNFLLGVSRQRLRLANPAFTADFDGDGDFESIVFGDDDIRFRRTSFALAVGGGIDIRVSDRFSVRALKFDYLPVFARRHVLFLDAPIPIIDPDFNFLFLDVDAGTRTRHNFRVGVGALFHF